MKEDYCTGCENTGEVAVAAITNASGKEIRMDGENLFVECPACLGNSADADEGDEEPDK